MTLAGELVLRVDPDSDGAALTGRATPPRLRFGVAAQGQVFMAAGAAQVASVLPRLARAAPGRRLRIQPQVGEDLLDDLPLEDGCDDLQFPGAAVRAVLHVDVEDALEKPRPADAVRPGPAWTVSTSRSATAAASVATCACAGGPCGTTRGRSFAFGASTPWNRMRCSRGRGTSAASRCMNSSWLMTKCVVPSRHGVLSLRSTCPAALSWTVRRTAPAG